MGMDIKIKERIPRIELVKEIPELGTEYLDVEINYDENYIRIETESFSIENDEELNTVIENLKLAWKEIQIKGTPDNE